MQLIWHGDPSVAPSTVGAGTMRDCGGRTPPPRCARPPARRAEARRARRLAGRRPGYARGPQRDCCRRTEGGEAAPRHVRSQDVHARAAPVSDGLPGAPRWGVGRMCESRPRCAREPHVTIVRPTSFRDKPRVSAGTVAQGLRPERDRGHLEREGLPSTPESKAPSTEPRKDHGAPDDWRGSPEITERARIRNGRGSGRRRCAPTVRLRRGGTLQHCECGRDLGERSLSVSSQFLVQPRGRPPSSASSSRTAAS